MTAAEAADWWAERWPADPYGNWGKSAVIASVRAILWTTPDFARAVAALEGAMPRPDPDVLAACEARLAAA